MVNSVISTKDARFMGLDIKDFYLGNILPGPEYIAIPVSIIPKEFFDAYNLTPYVHNGRIYAEVNKGMYGLPQAGRVASDALIPRLAAAGYTPTGKTPGLFRHKDNSITFCLVVDDFGVKYTDKEDALHLIATLKKDYTITEDWEGKNFCGIDLDWNYKEGWVDISMKGYVAKALQRFTHEAPKRKQHAPSKWSEPAYGAKIQYAEDKDTSTPLTPKQITRLQEIIGTFYF